MPVFDAEFVDGLRQRYASTPVHLWPPVAQVALGTDDAVRDRVEAMVARLDPADTADITTSLRNADFVDTLNEVLVGHVLLEAGAHPRYEQEYETDTGKLTPDWSVSRSPRNPAFILDVFTLNPTDDAEIRERMETDLQARIAKINENVVLTMEVSDSTVFAPTFNKNAAHEVRQWLRTNPPAGSTLPVEDARFTLGLRRQQGGTHLIAPVRTFFADTSRFESTMKAKADKYARVQLPLVIAVVADFRTGLSLSDLDDVLARRADRLFAARPTVAGVLWVESDGAGHRFIPNPATPNALRLFS
jgi:hypothetical protein